MTKNEFILSISLLGWRNHTAFVNTWLNKNHVNHFVELSGGIMDEHSASISIYSHHEHNYYSREQALKILIELPQDTDQLNGNTWSTSTL